MLHFTWWSVKLLWLGRLFSQDAHANESTKLYMCLNQMTSVGMNRVITALYNGILVPVRISFGLPWYGSKTYNVSTMCIRCGYAERRKECVG